MRRLGALPVPGQSWHTEALPTALMPAKALKFAVENPSVLAHVVSGHGVDLNKAELPMPPPLAMRLLVDASFNAELLFSVEWGEYKSSVLPRVTAIIERHFAPEAFADVANLSTNDFPLPTDVLLKDLARDASGQISSADVLQLMTNMLATFSPKNAREGAPIEVEFTRFDLSNELAFDAITVDFPSQSAFLQRHLVVNQTDLLGFFEVILEDEPSARDPGRTDRYNELDMFF